MTTEVKDRTDCRTARTHEKTFAGHFQQRRDWMPCPRCIGGNMYSDHNGEHVCIQCGFSCSPGQHQAMKGN
jgi:hypothetical protein